MASTRISAPIRGVTYQLSKLPIRQDAFPARCTKCPNTLLARSITTSTSSKATVSPIITSTADYVPIKPHEEQTVLATIHQFPSLEPLRFETYPVNHLYLPTRRDILHRAVVYEGDMTRLGTASTKNRHEVRGSARKIRPQKGSGRARLGDKKSPMLRGGGVAFGPRPRDFSTELQKKVYDLAWRTALSYRFRKGELIIVDNAMEIESPSTRLLNDIFKHHEKLRGKGRSLLVTLEERPLLQEALLEMDRGEQTLTWEEVDVKNLLELSRVIIERDALHNILLTHEEDLTHKAIRPWHKNLVRSSPPAELESIIGWAEFRDLQLLEPKEQEAARSDAYESVASKRYAYADSLPQGPKRTDLMASAYNLLAEAKELQFQQRTGMLFADYRKLVEDGDEDAAQLFPRIQALEYQREVKLNSAGEAMQTSPLESEELEIEASAIEVEKLKLQHKAALLAAQVLEHRAEAQRLQGDEAAAEESIALASSERTTVDILDTQILETKLALAKNKYRIQVAKGTYVAQQKAKKEVDELSAMVAAKQAEQAAYEQALEDKVETDERDGLAMAPVTEEMKAQEKR